MFCPNCGQQEISSDMRFCSRCGFQMGFVRELIVGGTALIEREPTDRDSLWKAFRGMRRGVWVTVVSFFLLLLTGMITAIDDDFVVLVLVPFLGFLAGFFISLYGAFVQGRRVKKELMESTVLFQRPLQANMSARSELSAARITPVQTFSGQRAQTAEMRHPPSVTENTTRLLDND